MQPLAHSARSQDSPPQLYSEHVLNSLALASANATNAASFWVVADQRNRFVKTVEVATEWHDLGKLDPDNQAALRKGRGTLLPQDHIDAGVAHCLQQGTNDAQSCSSAWLIRAHHAPGLPSQFKESLRGIDQLRGNRRADDDPQANEELIFRNNRQRRTLVEQHHEAIGTTPEKFENHQLPHGIPARLALSCLVDADHSDSARFDQKGPGANQVSVEESRRWEDRLNSLKIFISEKQKEARGEPERNQMRQVLFNACCNIETTQTMVSCDASVGLGKTTALLAYLLRQAAARNLRRIVIVAPFTNILTQTANTLREAIVLEGEDPDQILLEHHHRADFSSQDLRSCAVTWDAPIILTTSVQFFETLGSNRPAALRKLHRLPGSGIFIDESHAALPFDLWPQCLNWLSKLASDWSCPIVLASGSQVRFWEEDWGQIPKLPQLNIQDITPPKVKAYSLANERIRCRIKNHGAPLKARQLSALVQKNLTQGRNQLVILNTVHSAAGLTMQLLSDLHLLETHSLSETTILHLSTALSPSHRAKILSEIQRRSANNYEGPAWILVATSCVEAGVDLDFHDGFREDASVSSLIQTSGRINRNGKFQNSVLSRIQLSEDANFKAHPAFKGASRELDTSQPHLTLGKDSLSEIVTQAVANRVEECASKSRFKTLPAEERARNYPEVADLCKVIEESTITVVVSPEVAHRLEKFWEFPEGERVTTRELLENSVQVWKNRIDDLGLEVLKTQSRRDELYVASDGSYDPFLLGLGKGIIQSAQSESDFCVV